MKIKHTFTFVLLAIGTLVQAQQPIKVEPYIAYQAFKNFGELANDGIIVDAISPNGFEYTFGTNIFYKNTGLKFETGNIRFGSKSQLVGALGVLTDELPEIPTENEIEVYTSKSGSMITDYFFTFKERSVGLVQYFDFEKIRLGISGSYGSLTARESANTGPSTAENGIKLYRIKATTWNLDRTDSRFYEFTENRQYNNGNYFSLGLEAGYNVFNRFYVFGAVNYKNGHFDYRTDKQETSLDSNWQTIDIDKLKFQTLGGKIGVLYSFGFDL